jgi:hypothetical protein
VSLKLNLKEKEARKRGLAMEWGGGCPCVQGAGVALTFSLGSRWKRDPWNLVCLPPPHTRTHSRTRSTEDMLTMANSSFHPRPRVTLAPMSQVP